MSQTLTVSDANMNNYVLSITTRDNGDSPEVMEELTFRTIKIWLWIASNLEQKVYKLPDNLGSVESRYAAEINKAAADTDGPKPEPFTFVETFGDARVTIWDTFKSQSRIGFHLNSDDDLQVAVDTWLANHRAIERAFAELATPQQKVQNAQNPATTPSNQGATGNVLIDTPATTKASNPAPAVEGAIVATRAPKSSEVQYSDGQFVSFTVTKIVASSNKGSPVYEMWTPLGSQWPTIKVYKLDTKGKEKPDYKAIVGILATLNLSLDKPEAMGTWRLIVKAAHVPGDNGDREFLNVVSIAAI